MGDVINLRGRSPRLWPKFIFNRLPLGRECAKQLEILHGFSRKVYQSSLNLPFRFDIKVIQERMAIFNNDEKTKPRRQAFLDSLLTQMQAEHPSLFSLTLQIHART